MSLFEEHQITAAIAFVRLPRWEWAHGRIQNIFRHSRASGERVQVQWSDGHVATYTLDNFMEGAKLLAVQSSMAVAF